VDEINYDEALQLLNDLTPHLRKRLTGWMMRRWQGGDVRENLTLVAEADNELEYLRIIQHACHSVMAIMHDEAGTEANAIVSVTSIDKLGGG